MPTDDVPALVRALYDIVHRLEELFPGRRFTLDGHLVGSIGEVIAAHRYGLTLRRASFTGCDATAPDGRDVEVKATQGDRVALRCPPSHLLVLHLDTKGGVAEVYNGCGIGSWGGPVSEYGRLCHGGGAHEGATVAGACSCCLRSSL
jgi:hypothetical protein